MGKHMRDTLTKTTREPREHLLSIRENGVLSWRTLGVVSLMGCIAIEVLFNLLPIDHNTVLLYWFFPASLLFFSQLYFHEGITKHVEIKVFLAFLVWGVLTVVLNFRRLHMVESYWWFACMCASVFLCFSLPYAFDAKDTKRVLNLLAVVTLVVVTLLCVLSMIAIYAKDLAAKAPSIFEGIDIAGGRLAIDSHPNRSAPAPAMGVILAAYLFTAEKKVWRRVIFVIAALVCFVPLALTASRTAILGAGLALGYMAFLALKSALKGRVPQVLRYALCAVAAVAVLFAFYQGAEETVRLNNAALEQAAAQTDPQAAEAVVERTFSDAESFNGRTGIWRGVWNGLTENPQILAYGTGPWMSSEVMAPYFPDGSPVGIFHNSLVGTLVAYGVVGLLLALLLLVLVAVAALRLSLGRHSHELAIRMLPAVLLFAVSEGMMEDFMFANLSFNIVWIWFLIAAGFTFRLLKPDAIQERSEEK